MCEITVTFTNAQLEQIIISLARYLQDGFRINAWSWCDKEYSFELVKY